MNKLSPTRALGWLIGLFLLFSWNLQAEVNPARIAPRHPVQSAESFNESTPAIDPDTISLTATVGELFTSALLPFLLPRENTTISVNVTGLPANGLRLKSGPAIGGTPLISGVMNLTLVNTDLNTNATAFRAITITVNPPLPPLSGTATVGVPFSFDLPFLIPLEGTTSVNVTGLPANGLSVKLGSSFGSVIGGTPLTSGVMNLTLVNSQTPSGNTAFRAITITVNPPLPPLSGTATVGVPFSFDLPFLIPLEGTTSVNVTGLPANGLSVKLGSSFGSVIGGTPLTSGVMNLTLVNSQTPSGNTAFRAITITVNPPLPPTSLTATVGTPFSYRLPELLPFEGISRTVSVSVTGLPANGLSFSVVGSQFSIAGTPVTAGVMSLTWVNTETAGGSGRTAWQAITITVNPVPGTPPTNNPPVAPSIASQTATVGVAYFQNTPSFTDPDGQAIAVQAFGLPPGLSYTGTASGIVAGTPTMAGVYSVSLVGTDLSNGTIAGGLSATAVYTIAVNATPVNPPPTGGALTLLQPTYDCATGAITFNTSGGDGTTITYTAVGIQRPSLTSNTGIVEPGLRADPKPLMIVAMQSGVSVSYTFDFAVYCAGGTPPPPPPPSGGTLALLQPTYDCASGTITFNTSGGDGTTITYLAVGIRRASPTSNTGTVESELRADPKPLVITATQGAMTVSYTFDFAAFCAGGTPSPPPSTPGGLALLAPTYTCATGAITFNTSGGDGTTITYSAVGVQRPSLTSSTGTVEPGLRADPKPLVITATQSGVTVSYIFNFAAYCSGIGARKGVKPETELSVVVLGNPTTDRMAQIRIRGAAGQRLQLRVNDVQGGILDEQVIEQATADQTATVRLGQSIGVYLMRVNTIDRQVITKIIRQ